MQMQIENMKHVIKEQDNKINGNIKKEIVNDGQTNKEIEN